MQKYACFNMFLQKHRLVQVHTRGRASSCTSYLGEKEARGGSSNEVHYAGWACASRRGGWCPWCPTHKRSRGPSGGARTTPPSSIVTCLNVMLNAAVSPTAVKSNI